METKHTPEAPWSIRERKGNDYFGPNVIECMIHVGTGATMGNCFASVSLGGRGATSCTPEDVRATARLIAAAPMQHELLDALDRGNVDALRQWGETYGVKLPDKWTDARSVAIKAAIRKVKGE